VRGVPQEAFFCLRPLPLIIVYFLKRGPLAIKLVALTPDGRLADPSAAPRELVPPGPSTHGPALDPQAPGGFQFPGYWWPGNLPQECWTASGKSLWFTSLWGSRPTAMRVQIDNGSLQRVAPKALRASSSTSSSSAVESLSSGNIGPQEDGSVVVLSALPQFPSPTKEFIDSGSSSDNGAFEDGEGAIVAWSTPAEPGGVAVVNFNKNEDEVASSNVRSACSSAQVASCAPNFGHQAITSTPMNAAAAAPYVSLTSLSPLGLSWHMVSMVPPDSTTGIPIEGILLLPPSPTSMSKPLGLIVVPHGGPHSATSTSFMAPYAYLAIETSCAVRTLCTTNCGRDQCIHHLVDTNSCHFLFCFPVILLGAPCELPWLKWLRDRRPEFTSR